MSRILSSLLVLIAFVPAGGADAADDCAMTAIATLAAVSVSDGTTFEVETVYLSPRALAARFIDDGDRLFAIEGAASWARSGDEDQPGSERLSGFALGHQYHALLTRFADLAGETARVSSIEFAGETRAATRAPFPYGGNMYLVDGDAADEPAGLRFAFPDAPPIDSEFLDWRPAGDRRVPHRIRIDDGQLVFDYRYTSIDFAPMTLDDFHTVVGTPAIDAVTDYRATIADACSNADLRPGRRQPPPFAVTRLEHRPATDGQ